MLIVSKFAFDVHAGTTSLVGAVKACERGRYLNDTEVQRLLAYHCPVFEIFLNVRLLQKDLAEGIRHPLYRVHGVTPMLFALTIHPGTIPEAHSVMLIELDSLGMMVCAEEYSVHSEGLSEYFRVQSMVDRPAGWLEHTLKAWQKGIEEMRALSASVEEMEIDHRVAEAEARVQHARTYQRHRLNQDTWREWMPQEERLAREERPTRGERHKPTHNHRPKPPAQRTAPNPPKRLQHGKARPKRKPNTEV